MSDVVSFAEIDGQYAELLPARTLMQTGGGLPGLPGPPDVDLAPVGLPGFPPI